MALHPKMQARAAAVKAAHAELSKTPGFKALPTRDQIKQTQAHASKILARRG